MLLCEVVHNRQCSRVITGSDCCSVMWFIIDSLKFTMKGQKVVFTRPPFCIRLLGTSLYHHLRGF